MAENKKLDELKKKLLCDRKNGYDRFNDGEAAAMESYCADYKAFLDAGKTERECAAELIRLAEQAGFRPFDRGMALKAGDKVYFRNRGKSVYLACIGEKPLSAGAQITAASALALSLGIAIQNFPEGAIISMPLRAEGESKGRAFAGGVLSGVVEPIGAVVTILAARLVIPALPYLLSFAAGAMLYVVVEELIPEMSQGRHSNLGTVFFAVGFSVMMVLDVALG